MKKLKSIGIFGGTFDPIHYGHLRAAEEVLDHLQLDEMRLVPCNHPPHRTRPIASAEDRLNMVRLAVTDTALSVDDRELQRSGPSYSVDTLMSFRRDFQKECLCMVVGVDAVIGLNTWYQWEKIIQLANIIVLCRTGWSLPERGPIIDFLDSYGLQPGEHLHQFPAGKIVKQTISSLDISATHIRSLISHKHNPQFLIPDSVLHYILNKKLYSSEFHHLPSGMNEENMKI